MPLRRLTALHAGASKVSLPAFFPSVSSSRRAYAVGLHRVNQSDGWNHPQFLVLLSISTVRPREEGRDDPDLHEAMRNNTVVLMDSGNYESYWMQLRAVGSKSTSMKLFRKCVARSLSVLTSRTRQPISSGMLG